VQVKWVGGQIDTTGLDAMDYFISDRVASPADDDAWYSEEITRLPDGYVCYTPPITRPRRRPCRHFRRAILRSAVSTI